jgi:hypothetical protein
MKYITEYIEVSPNAREARLSHVPVYVEQSRSYALLEDSFKLFLNDFSSHLPLWGKIEARSNGFYLVFSSDEDLTNHTNVVVTYAVLDGTSSNINYSDLLSSSNTPTFNNNNVPSVDYNGYIVANIEHLASQYKHSERLKAIIGSFLSMAQDVFLVGDTIPYMLDLERATGFYLDLIGKIVGVGRVYCGDFKTSLNVSVEKYKHAKNNIDKIVLSDDCMRKFIKVKIVKNVKEIVSYKELGEILSIFLEQEVFIESCGDFSIKIPIYGGIDEELRKCLTLLRAFIPLPPTIQLLYIEVMKLPIDEKAPITSYGIQKSVIAVQKAPIIPVVLTDKTYVVQHHYQIGTMKVEDINE